MKEERDLIIAPSNIALIKYMGKEDSEANLASNPSLSLTLSGLHTEIIAHPCDQFLIDSDGIDKKETVRALTHVDKVCQWMKSGPYSNAFNEKKPGGVFKIKNTFPKGAGIASSASAFAALTLATLLRGLRNANKTNTEIRDLFSLKFFRFECARISRIGSGSSCRSFYGPLVNWDGGDEVHAVDSPGLKKFGPLVDIILLIDASPKEISSSEAHRRVKSSPLWENRIEHANLRRSKMLVAFDEGDWNQVATLALNEAMEMHQLFHSSEPSFSYWKPKTIEILGTLNVLPAEIRPLVTLDAGPNIHLIIQREWRVKFLEVLKIYFPEIAYLEDEIGVGPSVTDINGEQLWTS